MTDKLKPCPFCGSSTNVEKFKDTFNRIKFGIECYYPDCAIQPFTAWYADEQEAIEAWNTRTQKERGVDE